MFPCVFFLHGPVQALTKEQTGFLQAEKNIMHSNRLSNKIQISILKSHPLRSYLEAALIRKQEYPDGEIQKFLNENKNSYGGQNLLAHWFFHWASKKNWHQLDAHPDWIRSLEKNPPHDHDADQIACALFYKKIDQKKALKPSALIEFFKKNNSFSFSCEKLFKTVIEKKLIPDQVIQQKIESHLRRQDLRWLEWLFEISPKKASVLFPNSEYFLKKIKQESDPSFWMRDHRRIQNDALLSFLFKKSLQHDKTSSMSVYQNLLKRRQIDPLDAFEMEKAIALTLASDYDPRTLAWLSRPVLKNLDRPLYEWKIRQFLKKQNWDQIIHLIQHSPFLKKEDFDQYWLARAYHSKGQFKNSKPLFNGLKQHRNYYGFLAHLWLKESIRIPSDHLKIEAESLKSMKNKNEFKRIEALYRLERISQAHHEWRFAIRNFSSHQKNIAAKIALDWKWYPVAIETLGSEPDSHHPIHLHYPLAFKNSIIKKASELHIDPAWIFAISRQESHFSPIAQSPKGALGLMQMKTETARELGLHNGSRRHQKAQLLNPEININLGTHFFKKLLNHYDNNAIWAAAAYNAGPTRVHGWLENEEKSPTDIWIETIPFRETRNYLKSVLTQAVIYESELNGSKKANRLMISGLHN